MQEILKKIAIEKEVLNEKDVLRYFYVMQQLLNEDHDFIYNKEYTLGITSGDDDDVVFNKQNNEYKINYKNISSIEGVYHYSDATLAYKLYVNDITKANIRILDALNRILSDIQIKKEIAKGQLVLNDPEAYVCLINERFLNSKKQIINSNYMSFTTAHYTSEILNQAIEYGFNPMAKYLYDSRTNEKISNEFIADKKYYPLEEAIILDSTPESPRKHSKINYNDLEEYILDNYGLRTLELYKTAFDKFIDRGYLRVSKTPYSMIHCSYNKNIKSLNEYSLLNKILLGKRLTEEEKVELSNCPNVSMLDYAIEKNTVEIDHRINEYVK